MYRTPVSSTKRKSRSPLENSNKKVLTSEDFPELPKMSQPKFNVEVAKTLMNEAKTQQLYAVQTSEKLNQDDKRQAALVLDMVAPLLTCMIESFDKMLKGQNTSIMKSVAEQQVNENNVRLQHSLVESVYETDKLECRQRYKNLRISGLEPNKMNP